jgi:hypothetical protein
MNDVMTVLKQMGCTILSQELQLFLYHENRDTAEPPG